ncbi:MAG: hypothetical protein ACUVT7_07455 [Thermoplasmata archaeon]
MSRSTGCYKKPLSNILSVGGLEVGIAGLGEIMDRVLEHTGASDAELKRMLLAELKTRNYVPAASEGEYFAALWTEFKRLRLLRMEDVEQNYHGIPREEIPWYPRVDERKCSGCSSCVEFCTQGVFTFDGKSHVSKPYSCMVGKSSCRSFCPEKAISFPTQAELKAILKGLREKHGIKA